MSDFRAASRYAKSLLELADEKGVLEEVHADMQAFSQICEASYDFTLMLRNPIINHDKKKAILDGLFQGKFNDLTIAIFDIITRKNREPILPAIAKSFHHQYNVVKGIAQATVTTAIELDESMKEEFEKIVAKISKKDVELHAEVDEDILGGFVLKIGDNQIDDSVKSKFNQLELEFSKNPYVKGI